METFDFAVGCPAIDEGNEYFVTCLKRECEARALKFIFIDGRSLERLTGEIKNGGLKIKFYLDMASETFDPKDPYTKFAYVLKDSGTRIVADPDDVKSAADKSITHYDLARANIPVPYTVLIRNWEAARVFTDEENSRLGSPFVIKPALGYGKRGVKIIQSKAGLDVITEARKVNTGDNFLVQEFIEPKTLDGKPAWFRVYHMFGEITPCWWNPATHIYQQVTLREIDEFGLLPMIRITTEIARITRIDWFSCEIAMKKKDNGFVVIDYMNDQCWVNQQSKFAEGVPDEVLNLMAERIVEKAWDHVHGHFTLTHRAIWFPKIQVKDENA